MKHQRGEGEKIMNRMIVPLSVLLLTGFIGCSKPLPPVPAPPPVSPVTINIYLNGNSPAAVPRIETVPHATETLPVLPTPQPQGGADVPETPTLQPPAPPTGGTSVLRRGGAIVPVPVFPVSPAATDASPITLRQKPVISPRRLEIRDF